MCCAGCARGDHLGEALLEPERIIKARVDLNRTSRALVCEGLVASLERHARQAEGGLNVVRLGREDLRVQLFSLVEQRVRQQPVGLDLLLVVVAIHDASASLASHLAAWLIRMSRRFWLGSAITRPKSRSRVRPTIVPGRTSSSAIRSSPRTARSARDSGGFACNSLSIRLRSSSSFPAPGGRPLPTLSAARKLRRSSTRSRPTRRTKRRIAAPLQRDS